MKGGSNNNNATKTTSNIYPVYNPNSNSNYENQESQITNFMRTSGAAKKLANTAANNNR